MRRTLLTGFQAGVLLGLAGCSRNLGWAADEPSVTDGPAESIRLSEADAAAIRATAAELVGGPAARDGEDRIRSGVSLWSDVPGAVARAGADPEVGVVLVRETIDAERAVFELRTVEGYPGSLEVRRTNAAPGWRIERIALGFDPDRPAFVRRAGRFAEAFGAAMERASRRTRYVSPEERAVPVAPSASATVTATGDDA